MNNFSIEEREALASFLFYVKEMMCNVCGGKKFDISAQEYCEKCKMIKSYRRLAQAMEVAAENSIPLSFMEETKKTKEPKDEKPTVVEPQENKKTSDYEPAVFGYTNEEIVEMLEHEEKMKKNLQRTYC